MAKDPAVLLYTQDFLIGSSLFTPLQKGHYITLLCYQQQSPTGSLSVEDIKRIMGKDFDKHWPVIAHKFEADGNGYFNQRMRKEIERRQKNSATQKENISKRWAFKKENKSIPRYENGKELVIPIIETEIEIENTGKVGMEGNPNFPTCESFTEPLPELKAGSVVQMVRIMQNIDIDVGQVYTMWDAFKVQNLTGKKFYQHPEDVFSHFINWAKNQKYNDGTKGNQRHNGKGKLGTSDARIEALKNF